MFFSPAKVVIFVITHGSVVILMDTLLGCKLQLAVFVVLILHVSVISVQLSEVHFLALIVSFILKHCKTFFLILFHLLFFFFSLKVPG